MNTRLINTALEKLAYYGKPVPCSGRLEAPRLRRTSPAPAQRRKIPSFGFIVPSSTNSAARPAAMYYFGNANAMPNGTYRRIGDGVLPYADAHRYISIGKKPSVEPVEELPKGAKPIDYFSLDADKKER